MKNRLSDADYQKIFDCIQAIHACRRMEEFPRLLLSELRKVVGCHLAGYNEVDLPRNRFIVIFDSPRPDLEGPLMEKFAGLMQEHPVITYFDKTGDGQALKISDFLSAHAYHSRAIYRECYRHVEVEDQLSFAVQIAPAFMIGIALNRNSRSFTEKDRLRLNLLRPHVIQAYLRLAEAAGQLERQQDLHRILRESGLGVIALNGKGDVIHSTPGAFECLARYVPVVDSGDFNLPQRIAKWIDGRDGGRPDAPLTISRDLSRLILRRVPGENRQLLMLSEENSAASMERLERFSLSAREREVLGWLAQGKSNSEIAMILGLTTGTVKLYVEHILAKLGVENRVLAALVFHGFGL